jgi:superfamily II DNA or RNA helicase
MTLSLSLEDLSHRYPQDIMFPALDLYQRERVGDLHFDNGRIEVDVEEEGETYQVRISLNNRGVPVDTDCTCSYCFQSGQCRHIAGVLIKLITEKITLAAVHAGEKEPEPEKRGSLPFLPAEIGRETIRIHTIAPLSPPSAPPSLLQTQSFDSSPPGAHRWTARMELVKAADGWNIRPVLVYIKKDGSHGRRDTAFNYSRITEPLPPDLDRIFRLMDFSVNGHLGVPFLQLAGFVTPDNSDSPIDLYNSEGECVNFHGVNTLSLEFSPVDFIKEGKKRFSPRFKPEFRGGGVSFSLPSSLVSIKEGLYLISEETILFYSYRDRPGISRLVAYLSTISSGMTENEIQALYHRFYPLFDENLKWAFIQKEIREVTPVPQPILTGRDILGEGAAFNLSFDYGSRGKYEYEHQWSPYERSDDTLYTRFREEEEKDFLVVFSRDLDRERKVYGWLKKYILARASRPGFSSEASRYLDSYDIVITTGLFDFLVKEGDALLSMGWELRIEKEKGRVKVSSKGAWNLNGLGYKEWLSFSLKYDENGESYTVDLNDFLQKGFLKAGTELIILTKTDRARLDELLKKGEIEKNRLLFSPLDFEALELLDKKFSPTGELDLKSIKKRAESLKDFDSLGETDLPREFEGELRPYQKGGYDWLHFLHDYGFHGCLADDMGLGKTIQALCFLQKLKERGEWDREQTPGVLVLAPVTTLGNWQREAEKFTPQLKVMIHSGASRSRSLKDFVGFDLILTSYQTFLRDAPWLADQKWHCLIMDEAQAIKNWQSKTRKAVKTIPSRLRLALTGTPVENGLEELWSLYDILDPGLLGPRDLFRRRYLFPIERDRDFTRTQELTKRLSPFLLRRKKEDVLDDLPDKEETIVWVEMEEEQRRLYEETREGYLDLIESTLEYKEPGEAAMVILNALLRLRQISLIPSLVGSQYRKIPSAKLDFLEPFLDDIMAEDHKILIFSQFVSALSIVKELMDRRGIGYAYLDGQTKNRTQEIDRFQAPGGPSVFLISLKAGGVGINLTAADYVVLLDPWWNPAVENQAVDRAHRMGQKRSVMVYRPIVKDSVEEKVLALQERKKELVSQLITEEGGFFKSLSREDVVSLFR